MGILSSCLHIVQSKLLPSSSQRIPVSNNINYIIIIIKVAIIINYFNIISYPDLLLMKLKARSGQVRKFNFLIGQIESE